MISAMRHFLRFIDLDTTFDNYGFVKKVSLLSISNKMHMLILSCL